MNDEHTFSRRGFLKLAAGSALGAAMVTLPSFSFAENGTKAARSLRVVALKEIPSDPLAAAKISALVKNGYDYIIGIVNTIADTSLKNEVLKLIRDPRPTFMEMYASDAAIQRLYGALAAQGLIDTGKLDAAHLLPPYRGTVQPFMTAPGSGYGSHHPYPGGLSTHVASNLHITAAICKTYEDVFLYDVHRDIAIAGQALHDIAKPFVFQWQADGTSLKEYTIAGQGAHHVLSLAEVIYRGFPAAEVVAQACAHGAPSNEQEEANVVGWLKAAALVAGKDPVAYGLLNTSGTGLPAPHHQEGYIVHLGDHDWVLTSPAAAKTTKVLKKIAADVYGMTGADLDGAAYNHFRNYVGAQLSYMYLNMLEAEPNGYHLVVKAVGELIRK